MEEIVIYLSMVQNYKIESKRFSIVASPLCLGNISKDWSTDNMKKTGLTGYVYDFSADYNAATVDDIKDIHKYLMKKNDIVQMKMFSFVKKVFVLGLTVLSSSITEALNCVSINIQECKVRPKIADINSNNPILYPFNIKINKFSGSCNNINNPYAKRCAPDTVKHLNLRVFNIMSKTNETRHIKWHETCKCICRLDKIICNSKQRWNKDKCRCECKELIDKGVCDKGYVWNPSNCECECDKSCNIVEYLFKL